jgi:hypothetical protein
MDRIVVFDEDTMTVVNKLRPRPEQQRKHCKTRLAGVAEWQTRWIQNAIPASSRIA